VDSNSDGYVDKVYIGDLGGQMWAFDVSFDTASKKSNTLWNAKRLTAPPASNAEKHPVYYQAAVPLTTIESSGSITERAIASILPIQPTPLSFSMP